MEKKTNLGKLLKVGDTFVATTKKMTKQRRSGTRLNAERTGKLVTYEVLRQGDLRHFTKGKRRYWCEVQGIVELKTGYYVYVLPENSITGRFHGRLRWYVFSYIVKIIEN